MKAKDGTCKPDDDGDGEPNDGEDTGKFSGGEDCKTPPQCSGDNILCGQARIQWRIDCNTRRSTTITGGNGCSMSDVPICAGEKCNALEYQQLLQAWRSRCAVEKLATGTPTTGDPATAQIRDYLTGPGQSLPSVQDPWINENVQPASWSANLGQGSCPPPIEEQVTILGASAPVVFSFQPICDFAGMLRALLLTCAAIVSLTIISGARK
ncbi:virulence factor TspB C-terminal domain-related protein [Lysobacter enzymogenes]|uniref:virulence factor TspB C-terminal domain-related protein n=1 Tax=Lysobacter enzymogenes TaxID=69 RepID=UPI0019CFBA27